MDDLIKVLKENGIKISTSNGSDLEVYFDQKEIPQTIVQDIRENKQALLNYLKQANQKKKFSQIQPAVVAQSYPLSSAQYRIWVISQLEGNSGAYNMPGSFPLRVADLKSFEQALLAVIERHEILRTVFRENEDGEIRQWICSSEELNFQLEVIELDPDHNQEEKIKAYMANDAFKPFDLADGPLIRACLMKIQGEEYLFYSNIHHIISDGWSMEILSRDVFSYYQAFLEKKTPNLPSLRIQYKDYASWQLAQLSGGAYEHHKQYWLHQLSGKLPTVDLPSTLKRPLLKTNNGRSLVVLIDRPEVAAIKAFCRQHGGTLFVGLIASLKALFHRYTGQQDFIVGSLVSGREHDDLMDQIGFYVNTIILRNEVQGEEHFEALFKRFLKNTLEAYNHQAYPFDHLVEELDLQRDRSRSTLFDVMINLKNADQQLSVPAYTETIIHGDEIACKFDLLFTFQEQGDYLSLELEYNTDIYETEFLEGFMRHYRQFLAAMLTHPDLPINRIDYLSESEKRELLHTFNDTALPYPKDQLITDLIEEQAARTPDLIAVVFGNEQLTYRELNETANQLAYYLRKQYSIQAEDFIGIQLQRSHWMIISIFAVLKSGGAYVPLDPEYPEDRLNYMQEDCNCKLVIDDEELEKFRLVKDQYYTGNQRPPVTTDNLAYVIYTSGSTGIPKGVMIEIGSLVCEMYYLNKVYALDTSDHILFYRSFSFDSAMEEYLYPFTVGARCYIAPRDFKENIVENSIHELQSKGITKFNMPSILLCELVNYLKQHPEIRFPALNHVITGGDVLTNEIAAQAIEIFSPAVFHNAYGPSENTNDSAQIVLTEVKKDDIIPIGYSIPNSISYILDSKLQLLPKGVTGELYFSGPGLARGYLNKPELTAERFLPSPFKAGERIYKSGDLGRWLPGGRIDFLGRIDNQVKIRGYRVELGEIQSLLIQHPQLIDAAVIVWEGNQADKIIVAYYVAEGQVSISGLKDFLRESLPEYMIPTSFVKMDGLPSNPNGKLDRKALPDPAISASERSAEFVAPRDEWEAKIVPIWEAILGKKNISVNESFFELGGHSLKIIHLISAYHKAFQVKPNIKELFIHTSLEAHARLIRQSGKTSFQRIPAIPLEKSYPLSSEQSRLWIICQFEGQSTAYNMPFSAPLNGITNIQLVEQAIHMIIERHEILRTVFREDGSEQVRQWIQSPEDFGLEIQQLDLRTVPQKEAALQNYIQKDAFQAFDLEEGPLLRISLIRMDEQFYVFYLNMHHIISDAYSIDLLASEMLTCYEALQKGETPQLPPLRVHYKDYVAWQAQQLVSPEYITQQQYWLDQLSGTLSPIDLPFAKKRPAIKSNNGHRIGFYVDQQTTQVFKQFCQAQEGTLFIGLLSLLNLLLYRYTGQSDLTIGSPVSGRTHPDLENQVGFYLNTIALRNQIEEGASFTSFFSSIRQRTLNAFDHQQYPFDHLVEQLQLERDTSRNAVFDIILTLQNTDGLLNDKAPIEADVLKNGLDYGPGPSKFDLDFSFEEQGAYLLISIEYNTDLFERSAIERLGKHFQQLMAVVPTQAQTAIEQIDYLSEAEKQQLLHEFNDTAKAYPREKSVVALFEQQAIAQADQTALIFESNQLTYRQLNEEANRLATYLLQTHDVQAEEPIAVLLDRSEWMIISILAILKTGAAYVPIDHHYPQKRIEYLLKDSQAKIVIDQTILAQFKAQREQLSTENPALTISPDQLAYIMYTSGSTGEPNGVLIEHRNIVRLAKACTYVELDPSTHLLSTGSFSFDATTFEYWGSLLNGGVLVLCPQSTLLDSQQLGQLIQNQAINTLWCTAGWFNQLVEENLVLFAPLDYLLVGGDRLSAFHINKVRAKYSSLKIINGYGPTENTTFSTTYTIEHPMDDIPIGQAVANSQALVLDRHLQLVPIGIEGEIYLAGDGLARGYLNRPSLNQEKFIAHPWQKGKRLYRSGDRGQWRSDGQLIFGGRRDEQIKIRGYRIEPEEIRTLLLRQAFIEDAIVVIHTLDSGAKEIYAYLNSSSAITPSEFRSRLQIEVPEYMIPQAFVFLEKMPLTANGKLDRQALPIPKEQDRALAEKYIALEGELENAIGKIWSNILQREEIGAQDNFFELGGHSLKVMALVNAYHKAFGVRLKVRDLFSQTSLSAHRQLIERSTPISYDAIPAIPKQESYLLSSAQRRLWILSQFEGGATAYNVPFTANLTQAPDIPLLEQAMKTVIARHEILRTVFKADQAGEVRQWILDEEALQFTIEVCDFRGEEEAGKQVEAYVQNDMRQPFDLEKGPLFRATLFQLPEGHHVAYFNMHHIISDGWSIQILFEDLTKAYQALLKGENPDLAPLRIHYKDYAARQQAQLSGNAYQQHRDYWLKRLAGELPVIDLPLARPRPAMRTSNGHRLGIYVSEIHRQALDTFCLDNEGTLFMGLLTILNSLLYQYATQEDLIVGTPISGRDHSDLENQIGFYLNILALRNQVLPNDSFQELFAKIRSTTLDAYHHQLYPFDELVDELNLKRDTSRNPVFDIILTLQKQDQLGHSNDSNSFEAGKIIDFGLSSTKFELDLNIQELNEGLFISLEFNSDIYETSTAERFLTHFHQLLIRLPQQAQKAISQVSHLSEEETYELLHTFNDTAIDYPRNQTIVDHFEAQVSKTPEATAIVSEGNRLSYQQLNERANQMANYLQQHYAIEAEDLIAIQLKRSDWLMVALLGILKAGAAYVPIDPLYPEERIRYILDDSQARLVLNEEELNRFQAEMDQFSKQNPAANIKAKHLAYVIYTSGSTGRPKGVMIEHCNVVNFFTGMSQQFKEVGEGTKWLAVTTISFDISVLELFWTLSRGAQVVIQSDHRISQLIAKEAHSISAKKLDFSLFYFASQVEDQEKYKLLLEGARFADENGFSAIWTPERHFHEFGGIFPNPAITSAAIATITQNIQIRSGSCVLPLHNPIRIAEEWSVVDNLSNGRVGISFASGWVMDDFLAFAPNDFSNRHQILYEGVETVRKLWKGESLSLEAENGAHREISIYPHPIQKELPIWITSGGHVETFRTAGKIGANLLTHLIGQTVEELEEKIKVYRQARRQAGHAGRGQVSLMIHTYLGDSVEEVKAIVREPFSNYLKSSLGLLKNLVKTLDQDQDIENLKGDNLDALVEHAFHRYFDTAALFGTVESCLPLLNKLSRAGIDEIGCLIDFGVKTDEVLQGFDYIHTLMESYKSQTQSWTSLTETIKNQQITHLQCTPSLMKMLLLENQAEENMESLTHILLGGEKLPYALAEQIQGLVQSPQLYNMYGPTETTIWSACTELEETTTHVAIGRPISNTQIYILGTENELKGIGETGELCIGGEGLARSYLKRPDLTAEKFIDHPFQEGQKIYRTGDLCRWLPDGTLDFIGRKDEQIKIRGYRIELGEIEYAMQATGMVKEAVAKVIEHEHADSQLVAYLVAKQDLDIPMLKQALQKVLPPYMLPDVFVSLDEMPLTANGKIDKKALPSPVSHQAEEKTNIVAARTPVEQRLVEIWADLLSTTAIGVTDNFFELGGHSLLAIKLVAKINQVFGTNFQLNVLFESPTIEQLAEKIDATEYSSAASSFLIEIQSKGNRRPLFCVPGAGGHVTSYYELSKALGKEQPFYAFQSPGLDGQSQIMDTVEEMAALYIREMQKIDPVGPYQLGGYSFGADVAFEICLQLEQAGYEVGNLFIFDSVAPHTNDNKNVAIEVRAFYKWLLNDLIGGPTLPKPEERMMLEDFLEQSLDEKVAWAFDKLGHTEWKEVSKEQFRRIVEVTVSNLSCQYTPRVDELPNLPIVLFKASERTEEEVEMYPAFTSEAYGWQEVTQQAVKTLIAQGNHHTFLGQLSKNRKAVGVLKNRLGKHKI